jgi:hypothetical protein
LGSGCLGIGYWEIGESGTIPDSLVAGFPDSLVSDHGITQWGGQALQDRRMQKKTLDFRRLVGQDFFE